MDVSGSKAERRHRSGMAGRATRLARSVVPGAVRTLRTVSLVGTVAFVLAVVALHGFRGDLSPAQHTISEYSLGKYGWLMRAAFASLGISAMATAAILHNRFDPTPRRNVGLLLLVGTAVGMILDALYNTDPPRVVETLDGAVHGDGIFIVCLTLPAAALILGTDFARSTLRLSLARSLQALAFAQAIAIIAFVKSPIAYRGLAERAAVTLGVATLAVLQACARDSAPERKTADLVGLGVEGLHAQLVGSEYRSEDVSAESGYGAVDSNRKSRRRARFEDPRRIQ